MRRIRTTWFLDEQMLSISPPTVGKRHRFSTTHAEPATTVLRIRIHTYPIKPTSDLPTATSVLCLRPLDVLPLLHHETTRFFFTTLQQPRQSIPFNHQPHTTQPIQSYTHARYIRIRTYPIDPSDDPHYAVRPHLTEVSNVKI